MQRCAFLSALPVALCVPLGACAAAIIPVAMGGLATREALKPDKAARARPRTAPTSEPSRTLPVSGVEPVAGKSAVTGATRVYMGELPPPAAADAPAPARTAPRPLVDALTATDAKGRSSVAAAGNWGTALRYVAGRLGSPRDASVLLARGATLDAPTWVPCADKPQAVLVDMEAAVPQGGSITDKVAGVLGAFETLDVTVLYTTTRTGPDLAKALARFDSAGLRSPDASSALFTVAGGKEAAARATAVSRYCVVAIIGSRADDFPNKATPGSAGARWNRGWFTVPGPSN